MNSYMKNLIIISSMLSVSLSGSKVDSVEIAKKVDDCRDSFVYRRDLGFVGSTQEAFNTFMSDCIESLNSNEVETSQVSRSLPLGDESVENGHFWLWTAGTTALLGVLTVLSWRQNHKKSGSASDLLHPDQSGLGNGESFGHMADQERSIFDGDNRQLVRAADLGRRRSVGDVTLDGAGGLQIPEFHQQEVADAVDLLDGLSEDAIQDLETLAEQVNGRGF